MNNIKLLSQIICTAKWTLEKCNLFRKIQNSKTFFCRWQCVCTAVTGETVISNTVQSTGTQYNRIEESTQNNYLLNKYEDLTVLQQMINFEVFLEDEELNENELKFFNFISNFKNCLPRLLNKIVIPENKNIAHLIDGSVIDSIFFRPFYLSCLPPIKISTKKLFENKSVYLKHFNRAEKKLLAKHYSTYSNNKYANRSSNGKNNNHNLRNQNVKYSTDKAGKLISKSKTVKIIQKLEIYTAALMKQDTDVEKIRNKILSCEKKKFYSSSTNSSSSTKADNESEKSSKPYDNTKENKPLVVAEEKCPGIGNKNSECNKIIITPIKSTKKSKPKKKYNLCKKCKPQNKLWRFRKHSPWTIWWYSLFGVDLRPKKKFRYCCNRIKIDYNVKEKPKEPLTFPKPLLSPSITHFSKDPAERINIKRQPVLKPNKRQVDVTQEDKNFFVESLIPPKKFDSRAKWAKTDDLTIETRPKTIQLRLTGKDKQKHLKNFQKPSVDSVQKKTQEFCKTLVELCQCKPKQQRKEQKKLLTQTPSKKSKNVLITNEEYIEIKAKRKNLLIPEHYSCGAGEIEREVKKMKKEMKAEEVRFKYREHCIRKPGEE